jgi:hypothetical protein
MTIWRNNQYADGKNGLGGIYFGNNEMGKLQIHGILINLKNGGPLPL